MPRADLGPLQGTDARLAVEAAQSFAEQRKLPAGLRPIRETQHAEFEVKSGPEVLFELCDFEPGFVVATGEEVGAVAMHRGPDFRCALRERYAVLQLLDVPYRTRKGSTPLQR